MSELDMLKTFITSKKINVFDTMSYLMEDYKMENTTKINFIKYLINKHNMNIYDNIYDGDNLLGYAVLRNNIDIVKYLIKEHKMNPKEQNYNGNNLLAYAVLWDAKEISEYLIKYCDMDPEEEIYSYYMECGDDELYEINLL